VDARAVAESAQRTEPPGTVLELDGAALLVVCGAGSLLRVTQVQQEGGRVLDARSAWNGRLLQGGSKLVARRRP
jgi:methionyl-tRNA formyltransferase